ncbi:MAG: 3,8-cyclase [Archaeoglobi archaeon]|nr:3,8-cyclase [Archaeoglobi archaeon]
MLHDLYGRPITNLRISVTQRCNLRCIYCHHEGQNGQFDEEIDREDILKVVKVAGEFGVRKLKITGGEPLLREDLPDIVNEIEGMREISITTNGVLLSDLAEELKECGVTRVNVSLDSLREERYMKVTGAKKGIFERVVEGIELAHELDLTPVKINTVLLRGINEDEIQDLINFVSGKKMILQLIELIGDDALRGDILRVEKVLRERAKGVVFRKMHNRPKYFLNGAEIEVVKPVRNPEFCMHCTRMRVTSDGKLKPCLLRDDNLVSIRGCTEEEIRKRFKLAVGLRVPYYGDFHEGNNCCRL